MQGYVRGAEAPSIVEGKDGRNYDEHLEHLHQALLHNDTSERDTILHNLLIYAEHVCGDGRRPRKDERILDDTDATLEWACEISPITIWKLSPKRRADAKKLFNEDHQWGAYLEDHQHNPKNEWITAHTARNAILLAVVLVFKQVIDPEINPTISEGVRH